MADEEPKRRVTVMLSESLVDALDGAVEDAPDYLSLSRSELLRYAVEQGIEQSDDVLDLVPDRLLAQYRTKRETERIQAEHYVVDKREGWRGRVKSYLNARLAGEEPYHPDGIELLAEGYRDEVEMLDRLAPESSRSVEDDLDWLDDQLDAYRDAYRAKMAVPSSDPFGDVDDAVEVGSDLLRLAEDPATLVEDIEDRAEGVGYDPDAVLSALATDYAVGERSIEVVLDVLLPDDVDPRRALRDLEDSGIDAILPPEAVDSIEDPDAIEDGRVLVDDREDRIEGDLAERTLAVEVEDVEDVEQDPDVDDDEVERIVDETIRGDVPATDGGATDDD
jgi:hypothetical protein